MSTHKPPVIEFPCSYPIKVMGFATPNFTEEIVAVVNKHAPGVCDEHVSVKPSAKGNYVSITIVIEATGEEQLTIMFKELKTNASVKMVL
ncbi:MAG: DUF493 domain-containing protein [Pseudohongiellaceae bacterium]|nr:DUF493 domain-containing protein [Pseudohongiellaceae bacterium]